MGRPAKLSRERLQTAALALVDAHGLAGLSMRALASELGSAPMTIYNHVAGRAELEVLVVEAVIGEADWSREPHDDWRDAVVAITVALWRAVRAHPHAIPLILTRRSRSTALLEASEPLLDALARSGRSGRELLIAFRTVTGFVMGIAQAELAGPLSVAADEPADVVIGRFRALPRFRYPRLIEIADAAATSDAEGELRAGLALVIAGLDAGLDATPSPSRRRLPVAQ